MSLPLAYACYARRLCCFIMGHILKNANFVSFQAPRRSFSFCCERNPTLHACRGLILCSSPDQIPDRNQSYRCLLFRVSCPACHCSPDLLVRVNVCLRLPLKFIIIFQTSYLRWLRTQCILQSTWQKTILRANVAPSWICCLIYRCLDVYFFPVSLMNNRDDLTTIFLLSKSVLICT